MRKVNLKNGLKRLGYTVVQYHKNYNDRSGFMFKDDQLYYFSYGDLRWSPTLLVRTADVSKVDRKGKYNDWTGGHNTYPINYLNRLGYTIYEPRIACDYNSN